MRVVVAAGVLGVLLGAAGVAQAQAQPTRDPYCRDLRLLVAAAAEQPRPFSSIPRGWRLAPRRNSPVAMICNNTMAGYRCFRSVAPPWLTAADLADRAGKCLGSRRVSDSEGYSIRTGGALLSFSERGTPRGHVGRTVSLGVEAALEAGR